MRWTHLLFYHAVWVGRLNHSTCESYSSKLKEYFQAVIVIIFSLVYGLYVVSTDHWTFNFGFVGRRLLDKPLPPYRLTGTTIFTFNLIQEKIALLICKIQFLSHFICTQILSNKFACFTLEIPLQFLFYSQQLIINHTVHMNK